jgi:hypothetical protein
LTVIDSLLHPFEAIVDNIAPSDISSLPIACLKFSKSECENSAIAPILHWAFSLLHAFYRDGLAQVEGSG